jgi:hypothetical protein
MRQKTVDVLQEVSGDIELYELAQRVTNHDFRRCFTRPTSNATPQRAFADAQ